MEYFPLQSLLKAARFGAWAHMEHFPLQHLIEIADSGSWAQMEHVPLLQSLLEISNSRRITFLCKADWKDLISTPGPGCSIFLYNP